MSVLGLLLAAGAGRRMGTPKGLLTHRDGTPYLTHAITSLREGGCDQVTVVVGAEAAQVAALVSENDVRVVHAADWNEGMGASLRAGLADAATSRADCALVTLVDLPDVDEAVTRRLLDNLDHGPATLGRASYDGTPGHPVLIGRDHWSGVAASARGDRGARDYLNAHPHALVECGDLATGQDVDTPEAL